LSSEIPLCFRRALRSTCFDSLPYCSDEAKNNGKDRERRDGSGPPMLTDVLSVEFILGTAMQRCCNIEDY
jgi:hypothetical protein